MVHVHDEGAIRLDVNITMTNDKVRKIAGSNYCNGSYATDICKKCGSFCCGPQGNWRTAKITRSCKNCKGA